MEAHYGSAKGYRIVWKDLVIIYGFCFLSHKWTEIMCSLTSIFYWTINRLVFYQSYFFSQFLIGLNHKEAVKSHCSVVKNTICNSFNCLSNRSVIIFFIRLIIWKIPSLKRFILCSCRWRLSTRDKKFTAVVTSLKVVVSADIKQSTPINRQLHLISIPLTSDTTTVNKEVTGGAKVSLCLYKSKKEKQLFS